MEGNETRNRTKDEVIEEFAKERIVESIVENINGYIGDDEQDLIQDIYLDLLNKDEEKIAGMPKKELRYFIARMVINNIQSVNSPFYYKYKKNTHYINIDDIKDKV